jgi:hypothetical protein
MSSRMFYLRFASLVNAMNKDAGVDLDGISMKLLEAMKKEFRLLRILWRQIYDQVSI